MSALADRVDALDWTPLLDELDRFGGAQSARPLLDPGECRELAELFDDDALFRSTVDMARHRYGAGRYRYFDYPLPPTIAEMRARFYVKLLPVAREWAWRLGRPAPGPDTLDEWLAMCQRAGSAGPPR